MAATDTHKATTAGNGTAAKSRRPRKALDAKSAGIKIAALLEALPEADRTRALHIAKTLSEPTP